MWRCKHFWEMNWQTRYHGDMILGRKPLLGIKCVCGYEKWKLYTLGNQSIGVKVTHVSMEVDS
jgi:hypothetical protein